MVVVVVVGGMVVVVGGSVVVEVVVVVVGAVSVVRKLTSEIKSKEPPLFPPLNPIPCMDG